MNIFSEKEIKAAGILQQDIPLVSRPFAQIAQICRMDHDALQNWIKSLCQTGIIRKFGAILRHQKAGYGQNALVTWAVPPDAMEQAGRLFAALPYISHCYERKPAFQDRYNLFTMLHAQDDQMISRIHSMAQLIACNDFLILESVQEYKKSSPEYF